ncbi:MAG: hypothetical protein JJU13_05870 [Balneolaceae bacterium]|nr:hypothetical protein [Balneolaceae bacterium]
MSDKLVLIGDIIGSKSIDVADREKVQQKLTDTLGEINRQSPVIESPLTVTLGDEFQGVYSDASTLLSDTWKVLAALHPVRVRFSVGIGEILTSINREQAIGMDGPAFHNARRGIENLKDTGYLYSVIKTEGDKDKTTQPVTDLVNHSLKMFSNEIKRWNKVRFQILLSILRGDSVKVIAGKLNISEAAVYKNREEGDLILFLHLNRTIAELLKPE